jgi:hypothetical protein
MKGWRMESNRETPGIVDLSKIDAFRREEYKHRQSCGRTKVIVMPQKVPIAAANVIGIIE